MSKTTEIGWVNATFNPWIGCTKVSPGCINCYAEISTPTRAMRGRGVETWGKGKPRHRTSEAYWRQPLKWNRLAAVEGNDYQVHLTLPGGNATCEPTKRMSVFPSLCDIWDTEAPINWLGDYLQLVRATPRLDHLILTKRPEHCLPRLKAVCDHYGQATSVNGDFCAWVESWLQGEPPHNVWLGVSVEDQKRADERIPLLLAIPAKVRFLSVEPLLSEVTLNITKPVPIHDDKYGDQHEYHDIRNGISWVIVGGEIGPKRRDCGIKAIASIAAQCVGTGTPCFVKQDCALKPGQQGRITETIWNLKQFPNKP